MISSADAAVVILKFMLRAGLPFAALLLLLPGSVHSAPTLPDCASGARTFLPCELTFAAGAADSSPKKGDPLRVEFRSPAHKTYLMHAYFERGTFHIRFSPTEPGAWAYHVLSDITRYNDKEGDFNTADSSLAGMVAVANLRHWRTTDKKPHLWLAAEAPFLSVDQAAWESWLDARKHDGFTHIRGSLLTTSFRAQPFNGAGQPDQTYFSELDARLLAAAQRGFTLDLLLADSGFLKTGFFTNFDAHDAVMHYLVARYGGLNVTWQGFEHFDEVPNARPLLKDLATYLQKYDGFDHPRSSDARASSFPLLNDGWMNFLIEASPDPQLGAVEHQFTTQPEIHRVNASEPQAFRHELWNATANGEYPSVSYASLQNEANVKAIQVWRHVLEGTRHWEFEPYFDVDGARAVGLNEVEYLAYAENPGIVEITLPRHKYNPLWINPATGEEQELKNYRGEVFSRTTPDNSHDWILQVPREGEKASMLKSVYFESEDPPIQEVESDISRLPFEVTEPAGDSISAGAPPFFGIKITRANRASRRMQFAWWGEIVGTPDGSRLLGLGSHGTFRVPPVFLPQPGTALNIHVLAINANGKAYEANKILHFAQ